MSSSILIVGELFVDFTITSPKTENKVRLGGVVHAARGAWALNAPYSVGVICPKYLDKTASKYLSEFGCVSFTKIGTAIGAPSVMVIADLLELSDQGYEDLLREEKSIVHNPPDGSLKNFSDVLIIPGKYDLAHLKEWLNEDVRIHIDVAYDIKHLSELSVFKDSIETIFISTSSELFFDLIGGGIKDLIHEVRRHLDCHIVLKENRGGSRVIEKGTDKVFSVPALLGETKNSVGVGDTYDAAFVYFLKEGVESASWKAGRVSSAYAQTTYPDTFKHYVDGSLLISVEEMKDLGGVFLPWEKRPHWQIYLASPDFSYQDNQSIEYAVKALEYHNFRVRRPVKENGELEKDAQFGKLVETYHKDIKLLDECSLVFSMPLGRDAGTLIEMGMAMERGMPVVVFDPQDEARNTMVVAGAKCYSHNLDPCLNSVFEIIAKFENG